MQWSVFCDILWSILGHYRLERLLGRGAGKLGREGDNEGKVSVAFNSVLTLVLDPEVS